MINSIPTLWKHGASVIKAKCLCIFLILSFSGYSQTGYNWTFSSGQGPFTSTPATTSTIGSYSLTSMASGTLTTGTTENPGLTPNCTSAIPVATFIADAGLEFSNNPQFVTSEYTIEMVVKFTNAGYRRLVGFYDLGVSGSGDIGIYLTPDGEVMYYIEQNTYTVISTTNRVNLNTWYHIAFTRTNSGQIRYYLNGDLVNPVGTYYSDGGDHFIPHSTSPHSNKIFLLKDDTNEEGAGKLAKVGIFNTALSEGEIETDISKICEGTGVTADLHWNTTGNIGNNTTHFVGTKDNQPLIVKTNNAEVMRITGAGQVLIGTQLTPANFKLAVGGAVIATKVRVNEVGSWPDYVFDKKYKLPSLYELERYIQQHQHLPGIPSAAEVNEKGVDLGINQAALLQKIEELTLYIIEQNKMILQQQKEIDILKERIPLHR